MKFKGDIIITDPCYIIKKDSEDWRKCDYGDNIAALGLTNYISESTRYGDWSCSTWSTPRKDVEAQLEELNALGRARWELMKQYGEVESTNMDEFYDADYFLTPANNDGHATQEIYSAKDDTLLYSNGDK